MVFQLVLNQMNIKLDVEDILIAGLEMEYTPAAVDLLAQAGYDPEFGARPVKRAIQNLVLNQLSRDIIAHNVDRDRPITVDAEASSIVFHN